MHELLHLLIVDRARGIVAVTAAGGRWLLPMVSTRESRQTDRHVRAWLRTREIDGHPVGQWFGRVAGTGAADWLLVIDVASSRHESGLGTLEWRPLDELHPADSGVEYQGWAVERASRRGGPSCEGPFGHPSWLSRVSAWVNVQAKRRRTEPLEVTAHRLSAYEVVLEYRATDGHWFFKGLSGERHLETSVAAVLAKRWPNKFPHTVALERRDDGSSWWLMAACPGTQLGDDWEGAYAVATEYAAIQQALAAAGESPPGWPRIRLEASAAWARTVVEEIDPWPLDTACAAVAYFPESWVAADLDPSNVILDRGHVRFIDLDDALWGPAPLGIATFARRVARATLSTRGAGASMAELVRTYERAWPTQRSLGSAWHHLQLVAEVVECQLAWQRLDAMVARGEVCGAMEMGQAAIRRRLRAAVASYRQGFT